MLTLGVGGSEAMLGHVLCLGAHCDDIEIGCSGSLLKLSAEGRLRHVTWVVFTSDTRREREAARSAQAILTGVKEKDVVVRSLRDGFLPAHGAELKEYFEELKTSVSPDAVLTHYRGDLHQDHRLVSELTWNTFRDHLILEYEIPKYDGDFGSPNVFVPLDDVVVSEKVRNLLDCFESQRGKRWFSESLFRSVLRIRGMECNAPSGFAEAFYCRKLVLG